MNRIGLHSGLRVGEAASADEEAAKKFVVQFGMFVTREEFSPKQVFNCDETVFLVGGNQLGVS